MKIIPLAFDSFGARSMATFVSTDDYNVLIDPGVELGPRRYGIPPTEPEILARDILKQRIIKFAKLADIIIVTHYHYDHHPRPKDIEAYEKIFSGKIVYAKDPYNNVNHSANYRGRLFEKNVKEFCEELYWADGKIFDNISFSPAVWHGSVGTKVGYVIMVSISEDKFVLLHGSDAQNFADDNAMFWVIDQNPDILIADGYPTYLVGYKLSNEEYEKSIKNFENVIKNIKAKEIILEHHILRDLEYKEKIADIFALANRMNKEIKTSAEFIGMENLFLEANRKNIKKNEYNVDVSEYMKKIDVKIRV